MDIYTVDFESFYDTKTKYGLKSLTVEEYVNSPLFHAFGAAIKKGSEKSFWVPDTQLAEAFADLELHKHAVIAHNAPFDMAILNWKYDVKPGFIIDTLSMARALLGTEERLSLAALAERFGLGVKGDTVLHMDGVRHPDAYMARKLGEYACNDADLEWELWKILKPHFPVGELQVIDMTVRMFTEPSFVLDPVPIEREIFLGEERKELLLSTAGCSLDDLRSDPKFAVVLESLGVTPPMKLSVKKSAKAGEPVYAYAFAKSDADFKALAESDNDLVRWACEARLGLKSTIKASRSMRFRGIQARMGVMPVALDYYGANTGRYAAASSAKANMQNLPSARGSDDADAALLRAALTAPEGKFIVVADLAQIEARMVMWLAGQDDVVSAFAEGRDVYSEMASVIFSRHVDRKKIASDFIAGFIGKAVILGCISEGELVLTDVGLVPIENVTVDMRVWDGVEWVTHTGVVHQGEKNVITYQGLTATPDHIVFLQDGTTCEFKDAAGKGDNIAVTGDGWRAIQLMDGSVDGGFQPEKTKAAMVPVRLWKRAVGRPLEFVQRIVKRLLNMHGGGEQNFEELRDAWEKIRSHSAQVPEPEESSLHGIRWPGNKVPIRVEKGVHTVGREEPTSPGLQRGGNRPEGQRWKLRARQFETGYQRPADDKPAEHGLDLVQRSPGPEAPRVPRCENCRPDGALHPANSEQYTTGADDDRRRNSPIPQPTLVQTKRTYDITNAGPRHRFTVSGKLVHNCGYGLGHMKFAAMIYSGMLGAKGILFDEKMVVDVRADVRGYAKFLSNKPDLVEKLKELKPAKLSNGEWIQHTACAFKIINTFRERNAMIPALWKTGADALEAMMAGDDRVVTTGGGFSFPTRKNALLLPSGMWMHFKELEKDKEGQFSCMRRKDGRVKRVNIWGGHVTENWGQALATTIVKNGMVVMKTKYRHRPILQVHDEVVAISGERGAKQTLDEMIECMTEVPAWAKGLPLAAEGGWGRSYRDSKG